MHVVLLGPCFKTGRLEAFRQHPEGAVPEGLAERPSFLGQPGRHGRAIEARCYPARPADADQHPAHAAGRRGRRQPGRTRGLQSLPPQQFQALFNSLFKVLFIFPSRYLFAIGLPSVFSLRWDLPPALGCIPKQPDSAKAPRGAAAAAADGVLTLSDAPFQGTWARPAAEDASLDYNSPLEEQGDFQVGLFPVRSPLLGESWLVSSPPLIDMLKFSGCSCLNSGRMFEVS